MIKNLIKKTNFGLARLLSNTSRYIDDLCIINYKHFENLITDIYPSTLIASRSGTNDKEVEYLDVKLTINETGLKTSVYHKVDDFNFPVTLLTFPENTMPYRMGIQVFSGQVIRYARICSSMKDFVDKTSRTYNSLVNRGYDAIKLRLSAERALNKHDGLLQKFGLFAARQLLTDCFVIRSL